MEEAIARKPQTNPFGMPVWHHSSSNKFRDIHYDKETKKLALKAHAAEVIIQPLPLKQPRGWIVEYRVVHDHNAGVSGRIWMSTEDLKTAFGISDKCEQMYALTILVMFGGDVAYQGRYIRYLKYLNIPGPGTGQDGDANVSIFLDADIMKAVREFLAENE